MAFNESFLIKLVKLVPEQFNHISGHIKKDPNFIKKCVKEVPRIINFLDKDFLGEDFFYELIQINNEILRYVDSKMIHDHFYSILKSIQQNGLLLDLLENLDSGFFITMNIESINDNTLTLPKTIVNYFHDQMIRTIV